MVSSSTLPRRGRCGKSIFARSVAFALALCLLSAMTVGRVLARRGATLDHRHPELHQAA